MCYKNFLSFPSRAIPPLMYWKLKEEAGGIGLEKSASSLSGRKGFWHPWLERKTHIFKKYINFKELIIIIESDLSLREYKL